MCREEGLDLSKLFTANQSSAFAGFGLMGVVKETGVDDEGLAEFYADYFTHPLYRDDSNAMYDSLGGRRLKLTTYNPLKWISFMRGMSKRHKEKGNLEGNMKGEGIVQGGIVLFNAKGEPQFAYREETGDEIPTNEILAAAKSISESS